MNEARHFPAGSMAIPLRCAQARGQGTTPACTGNSNWSLVVVLKVARTPLSSAAASAVPSGGKMPISSWPSTCAREQSSNRKTGLLSWKVDPGVFFENYLSDILKSYKLVMEMALFDPQKVGKNISAYEFADATIQATLSKNKLAA
jgi:hypothetical protein